MNEQMKTALSIAGSDSSGGAGIQADLKTMSAHGIFAMTAVTALTAQNTTGVTGILESTPEFLSDQLDAVFTDIFPDAVKIGMVSSAALIEVIADKLEQYRARHIVVDPVMVSTSGSSLMQSTALSALKARLLPLAEIVTPNIPEAEVFSGIPIRCAADMEAAARRISDEHRCAVLLKGGHDLNDANDLLYRDGVVTWFCGRRIANSNTHGTGCTLSSAIASNLAKGMSLNDAVQRAKDYISGALASMLDLGRGRGPMNHLFDLKSRYIDEAGQSEHHPRFTEALREAVAPIWEQCLAHPFVTGIGDGTLPVEKFRYYMLQDYLYLYEYARVFAIGVAKARDPELMRTFAAYVGTILDGEMNTHRAYMARLGITKEQAAAARSAPDNLSYTSYMLGAAHSGSEAEIVAAILSCSWSYAEIGRMMAQRPGALTHPFYGEWAKSYASPEYAAVNQALIDLMDRLASGAPQEQLDRLTDIFVRCSRYELSFWDMAWEMRK